MELKHGRTEEEWDELVSVAFAYLKKKAGRGSTVTYTELNLELKESTGQEAFNFEHPEGRNAIGDLLGDVAEKSYDENNVLLSAIVMYGNENKPGQGFFNLARSMGLLAADATPEEKEAFWLGQYNAAIDAYSSKRRGRKRNLKN
ncbi:hypothetical protein ACXZ66_13640 [Corynebacterium sp. S7]